MNEEALIVFSLVLSCVALAVAVAVFLYAVRRA